MSVCVSRWACYGTTVSGCFLTSIVWHGNREREPQIDFSLGKKLGKIKVWRTLIVEDNVAFRQTLKNLLFGRFPFMHFDEAKDGEEAIEKIKAFQPDLVFMDIKLPGESGLEVTKKTRASKFDGLIIIITSYDFQEYRDAAKSCGADYFVSKGSSTADEILMLVDSILLKHVRPGP